MEDNLKSVVALANRLCRAAGVQVDTIELAYLASLLEQQGAWASSDGGSCNLCDSPLSEPDTQALAQQLADRAMQQDPTDKATMQLQIALEAAYQQQQQQVEEELQQQADKVDTYLRAATRAPHGAPSMADYERIFGRVLDYVAAKGGLQQALSGGDGSARAEAYAALESVFPLSGVAHYCSQAQEGKEAQLESLAHITVGILLFNQSRATEGSALPASAATYLPQAQRLLRDVSRTATELRRAFDAANTTTSSGGGDSSSRRRTSSRNGRDATAATPAPRAVYAAQALAAALKMASDLQGGIGACEVLAGALEQGLAGAQGLVGASSAVPKEQVLPTFEQMGVVHAALGQELRLLVVRQRLFDAFEALLRSGSNSSSSSSVPPLLPATGRGTAAASVKGATAPLDAAAIAGLPSCVEYVPPEAGRGSSASGSSASGSGASNTLPADVALAGLCPWSIAHRQALGLQLGALAQPSVGCLRYQGCTFGFSSAQALLSFAQQPAKVLQGVHELAHEQPLLYHLLRLSSMQQDQQQGMQEQQEEQPEQQAVKAQQGQQQEQEEEEQQQEQEQYEQQAEEQHQQQQEEETEQQEVQEDEQPQHEQEPQQEQEQQHEQAEEAEDVAAQDEGQAEQQEQQEEALSTARDSEPAAEAEPSSAEAGPGAATAENEESTADVSASTAPAAASNPASARGSSGSASRRSTATASTPSSARAAAPAAVVTAASRTQSTAAAGASSAAKQQPVPLSLRALMDLMAAAPLKADMGTQTPTHFVERHIDVNYEWNEWALRRRIIALAKLRNKATHSAQTVLSHFRRDGQSQTWAPKQAASQTPVNKGQSMPRKVRYVAGLRGAPGTKMKVVSLELELGQPHQH